MSEKEKEIALETLSLEKLHEAKKELDSLLEEVKEVEKLLDGGRDD